LSRLGQWLRLCGEIGARRRRPRPGLLNKETRNAGEKPVHGFMGSLLNPKAAVLALVY